MVSIDKNHLNAISVAIVGGNHHNTLGVVRSLGEQGISKKNIQVLLVGDHIPPTNIISVSKYVLKENVACSESYGDIIPWLQTLAADGIKRVVICCSDGASEMVISHQKILSDSYYLPTTDIDICQLMKKDVQDSYAADCQLHIPKSIVPQTKYMIGIAIHAFQNRLKALSGQEKMIFVLLRQKKNWKKYWERLKHQRYKFRNLLQKKSSFS